MVSRPRRPAYLLGCLLLALCGAAPAADRSADLAADQTARPLSTRAGETRPAIAIIIDDLGNLKSRDARALRLPGAVTYAFLPLTPHAHELALRAHGLHKEVMLHLPMQSVEHNHLGPGALTLDMSEQEFARQLQADLASVPHAAGINNHMGSLLTQHPGHMAWLMREMGRRDDLYFVDSYTSKTSVAGQLADEHWVPNLRRDVFLDSERQPADIQFQFDRLLQKARENGTALGIGHPYPETLALLEQELPRLSAKGITLVPVSRLIALQAQRAATWRTALAR